MPGIYSKDNFAQQLASAIENAQTRRQGFVDREAKRVNSNVEAIQNFGKALGRWWELRDKDDAAELAKLQKEREEVVAAQKARDDELRKVFHVEPVVQSGEAPAMQGYVPMSKYTDAMRGYRPTESLYPSRPSYSDVIKRGGLY